MNPALREGSPAIHGRPAREGRIRKLIAFLLVYPLLGGEPTGSRGKPARARDRADRGIAPLIPLAVTGDLRAPPVGVCLRPRHVIGARVPEAAVDEDRDPLAREEDIDLDTR